MSKVGKMMKAQREARGMSQEELAKLLCVTRQTVSNYENGKSNPDIEMLEKIAKTFDVDIETLIYGKKRQVDKKQVWKIVALFACCIGILIAGSILSEYDKEISYKIYMAPGFQVLFEILVFPIVLVIMGSQTARFIVLMTGGKRPDIHHKKSIFRGALLCFVAFVLIVIPYVFSLVHARVNWMILQAQNKDIFYAYKIDLGEFLGEFYIKLWGIYYPYRIVWYLVFVGIGSILYLTYEKRKKREKQAA